MLSRVANAIYWTSRYVERAENVARFVDVNLNLMLDAPVGRGPSWEPLVMTTGDHAWFFENYGDASPDAVMRFLTFDRDYPNSILASLIQARENARTVRNIVSTEMWQSLNDCYLMVLEGSRGGVPTDDMSAFYSRIKLSGIFFEGLTDATLSRGPAWHFFHLGRMLERADKTSRILDVKYFILLPQVRDVGTTVDQVGWAALLNSASALQMYRQRYHTMSPDTVAAFLLLDANFPRSIHYCLVQAQQSLHALTGSPIGSYQNEAERLLGQLRARLDYARIDTIMSGGLHEYLDEVQKDLNEVGAAIGRAFFET